ncbi:hypothetical protein C0995_010265, partial [Termitomyces sp. Mi166
FFQNTGTIAGTFTVISLVVLTFLIFLATYIIWRRHRAKFNHELDEATSEAAKASVPAFLVDDVHGGAEGGVYSDTSSYG